ncbi:MAG: hypothetical protein U0232_24650 [Thermomicrobiales bacterium]
MERTEITVTLDKKIADELREVAGAEDISAMVNDALRRHLQRFAVRKMLKEMEGRDGPIPEKTYPPTGREFAWPD